MITLVPIAHVPAPDIEQLLDEAFGTDRQGRTAYRLREKMAAIDDLSLAALEDGVLIGSIQCWPVELADEHGQAIPLILVGPVAVRPGRQRDGIGRILVEAMIERAEAQDSPPMVLIGDPEYYDRFFGFVAQPTAGWSVPGPVLRHRLLARLRPGQELPIHGKLGPRRSAATLERERQ